MHAHNGVENPPETGRQGGGGRDGLHPLIGGAVRNLRMSRRWRQEDLAARATTHSLLPAPTLTRNAISSVELNQRSLDLNEVVTLLAIFEVTWADFIGAASEELVTWGPDNYIQASVVLDIWEGRGWNTKDQPPQTWAEAMAGKDEEKRIREIAREEAIRVFTERMRMVTFGDDEEDL